MYYRLESDELSMTAFIRAEKGCHQSLVRGILIDVRDEELPYRYAYTDPTESPLFDYYSGKSLMSKRLVEALESSGADNLQKLEVELANSATRETRNDYCLVNIVGLVECANVEKSDALPLGAGYYFRNLVVDPVKTRDLLVFRLAESLIDVIVHERVAKAIQGADLRGVVLKPLEEGR